MKHQLQLRDLYLGMTDAKHELLASANSEFGQYNNIERFLQGYLLPENIKVEDYIDGPKYIISGLKGTGKTALLRYLCLRAEERGIMTKTILFKNDFNNEDKHNIGRAARCEMVDKKEGGNQCESYEAVWRWFFHRQIVSVAEDDKYHVFLDDDNYRRYCQCVIAPNLGNKQSGIWRLFPRLKKGSAEIGVSNGGVNAKLGLEFDWDDEKKTRVKFANLVQQADRLFMMLRPKRSHLYFFIDELELALTTMGQYKKDRKIIADLIKALYAINKTCCEKGYNVKLIAAIRTEVAIAIQSSGQEINKITSDYGVSINWHQAGGSVQHHPLFQIVSKRISASERRMNRDDCVDDNKDRIWHQYFPDHINNKDAREYILHQTWYRPRDIVRMLNIAQKSFPDETCFAQRVFDATRKEYSLESWVEIVEELRVKYSEEDMQAIKMLLLGIRTPFVYNEFCKTCENKSTKYSTVKKILDAKARPADILNDLYHVGVIGNCGQRVRYAFRADDELLLDMPITVHDALRPILSC